MSEHCVVVNGREATHYCVECGALWILYPDSWSLASKFCGKCCDNVTMGDQIRSLPGIAPPAEDVAGWLRIRRFGSDDHEYQKGWNDALERAASEWSRAHPPVAEKPCDHLRRPSSCPSCHPPVENAGPETPGHDTGSRRGGTGHQSPPEKGPRRVEDGELDRSQTIHVPDADPVAEMRRAANDFAAGESTAGKLAEVLGVDDAHAFKAACHSFCDRDDLAGAVLSVSTDLAQDAMEDPVGSAERERAGFYRLGKGSAERIIRIARGLTAPPEKGPGERPSWNSGTSATNTAAEKRIRDEKGPSWEGHRARGVGERESLRRRRAMSEKLKPCPFCGTLRAGLHGTPSSVFVECDCGANGPLGDDADDAVKRWNEAEQRIRLEREAIIHAITVGDVVGLADRIKRGRFAPQEAP